MRSKLFSPFWLPIWSFLGAISLGGAILHFDFAQQPGNAPLSWLDALFTSTSAVCVTGLVVVDTGTSFSFAGQGILLCLIQLGGLGVMTYSSLIFFLLGRRVSLADRTAVGKTLLHDPSFSLRRFILLVVLGTLALEAMGASALFLLDTQGFSVWSAVFHSVSAFCNAGFSLEADSLTSWRGNLPVNLVFIFLITVGGLGFFVIHDCVRVLRGRWSPRPESLRPRLTWHSRMVLSTSLFLVLAGTVAIFFAEMLGGVWEASWSEIGLAALFQSVSCRTAGFNSLEVGNMTNVSLLVMIGLMFVGGSPGSCAGGVKTTTARVMWAFLKAQFRGGQQVKVGRFAVDRLTMGRAFTLVAVAAMLICTATLVLNIVQGGDVPHAEARGLLLETLFEATSAFGTAGLSTGMTANLSVVGKLLVMTLMLVGRLGPIWLLSALVAWQEEPRYRLPEKDVPLG
ncbi:trk system potassium uptake protein TrkH [Paucidesulfovibrio gracilis DSM 16080]|uniref:Trk system potassium uptake protein TrkH n=1 Tax=Paucidesulfovibrio gracilis DSM 16080 TaxID=1121449 RepID=A0A1T4X4L5_9BACT|nr:potassium transporter TrkG [Paucidesulfovibrio gracilis]SKA84486.1 trk system potassium uptake protein TrkH [Paucidesulfovibrio gracilis DSM 16080]